MRRVNFFLLLFALLITSTNLQGQDKKLGVLVGGGISPILGPQDLKDNWSMGFNFMGELDYYLSPQFAIGAEVAYNRFSIDAPSGVTVDGGTFSVLEILGLGKYVFNAGQGSTSFYLVGGAGAGRVSVDDVTISGGGISIPIMGSTETKLMLTGGPGVQFAVGSTTKIFVEGRFGIVLTEGESVSFLPVRAGVAF